jgi:hypothetical protein
MSKLALPVLCLLLALAPSVSAQAAPLPAPTPITAQWILEKNLIATGGREAHQRLQSLVVRGDYSVVPGGNRLSSVPLGQFAFSYKGPANEALQFLRPEQGTLSVGHREGQAFTRHTPKQQASDAAKSKHTGPRMIELVDQDWRSTLETDFSSSYEKIELIGRAKVNDRWAYGVRFTTRQGDQIVRFYDYESFLLVRMDQVYHYRGKNNASEVPYTVRSYFKDYKDHDGVKLPHLIVVSEVEDLLFKVSNIQPNAKIDDSVLNE